MSTNFPWMRLSVVRLCLVASSLILICISAGEIPKEILEGGQNNWAVLIGTSRYFYNYRHASNTLGFYHTVKRLGIPDSQILLFLAEDYACNPRNREPGAVYNSYRKDINLYGENVEVDYRGDEVTVESFLRLMTGRHSPWTPRRKRLLTDHNSNILVYATGHSGAKFLKFQDWQELQSQDIADAFQSMYLQGRYRKVFWVSDTCQAQTLQDDISAPNVLALGSSAVKQNSYSHHMDDHLGVAMIDRFTFHSLAYFERHVKDISSPKTIRDYMASMNPSSLLSEPVLRTDLIHTTASGEDITHETLAVREKAAKDIPLTDFIASTGEVTFHDVNHLEAVTEGDPLRGAESQEFYKNVKSMVEDVLAKKRQDYARGAEDKPMRYNYATNLDEIQAVLAGIEKGVKDEENRAGIKEDITDVANILSNFADDFWKKSKKNLRKHVSDDILSSSVIIGVGLAMLFLFSGVCDVAIKSVIVV